MDETHHRWLRLTFAIARRARERGNPPFGSVLVDRDGNLLLEAENDAVTNRDVTGHAETNLVREASRRFPREVLEGATLYTSAEPCAMCAGAIYWSGISRVVFGLRSSRFYELMGENPERPPLRLPCREVFAAGQRQVEVLGPILESEAEQVHTDA